MAWWCFIFSILRCCYTLNASHVSTVHTITPISGTMLLWSVSFVILSQTFDASSICCFPFAVKGGVFFLNPVEALKMSDWQTRPSFRFPWGAWEFLISSAWHLIWYYTLWCCALPVQFIQAPCQRRERELRILTNTSSHMFVNPAENKIMKLLQSLSCLFYSLITYNIKILFRANAPEKTRKIS